MSAPATYDVYFSSRGRRFYFQIPNHGVTLTADRIAWSFEGEAQHAGLATIVAVHLQSGGSWQNVIDQCRIGFADGTTLTIINGAANGIPDDKQRGLYRDFVRDLHRRLAAKGGKTIAFTAGYTKEKYRVVLVGAVLLGAICVGVPLVLLLITREARVLFTLAAGGVLCLPLHRMVRNNAPRRYEPGALPDDLLR